MSRLMQVILLATTASLVVPAARAAEKPLTPRTAFFGNPVKAAGRLSPDGKWLSWVAPVDGVLNVWVAPIDAPDKARVMTAEKKRPVAGYFWSQDSKTILYATDNGGDENYQIFAADVATGARRAMTHFQKTRVGVLGVSHDDPDHILITANNRDPRFMDVLKLDLKTDEVTPVFQNDIGYAGYLADHQLNLRMALRLRPDGVLEVYKIVDGKAEPKPFVSIPFEDVQTTSRVRHSADWTIARIRQSAILVSPTHVAASERAKSASASFGSHGVFQARRPAW